jgi:GT2 family glycosyltransferase
MTERAATTDRAPTSGVPPVTVITLAYSMDRWSLTCAAIESVLRQTTVPLEIIIPVDHNPELLHRLNARWSGSGALGHAPSIFVIESRYEGHQGASSTTAAEVARGEYLAFLDDDASAQPDWLEHLLRPFADPSVIAVGGAPLPVYAKPRPRWFPAEFNWVFGCAYAGLPTTAAPIHHLIGTTMAVRRRDLLALGGIRLDDYPDMELSHRLLALTPGSKLIYEPAAVVNHYVPKSRLSWSYFWRRCFFVNRGKVAAMRDMGPAANLGAERRFVARALTRGVATGLCQFVRGDLGGLLRAGTICIGLALAGAGYAVGTVEYVLRRRRRTGSSSPARR